MKLKTLVCILSTGCILATTISAQNTDKQVVEKAELERYRTLARQDQVEGWYGLARLYAHEDFTGYDPDSAYSFLQEGLQAFRKLKKGQQRKLARQGIDRQQLVRLKNRAREQALDQAVRSGSSRAVETFLENYGRLSYELQTRAYIERNRLALQEMSAPRSYDSLQVFLERYRESLAHHSKNLWPEIEAKALEFFFLKYDRSDLRHLITLLSDFPSLAGRLDGDLSRAFQKWPCVTYLEQTLEEVPKTEIPLTVRTIYQYYTLEGDPENLLAFNARYPAYLDSFRLKEEFSIARHTPDFTIPYEEGLWAAYDQYIRQAAPRYRAFVTLQRLIAPAVKAGQWDEALRTAEAYASYFGDRDPRMSALLRILRSPAPDIRQQTLGGGLNTGLSEYAPVISADGRQLFFCRRGLQKEDIYRSSRSGTEWTATAPVSELNTPENEAPLGLSGDAATLLLFDNGAVKTSDRQVDGWGKTTPFFPEDNESLWQGGTTLASDRQVAIFAARRNDVVGLVKKDNIDLYIVFRQPDDSWSEPVNLGATINTPFEDRSPFLHPDNRTLYFSSDGHGGLGGLDVFKTTRIGDSWTEWTWPVNLGKVFNDTGKNWGYKVSTDGSYAYFAADNGTQRSDLFRIDLPAHLRPERVFTISGILRGVDGQPLAAEILLEDLNNGKIVGTFKSDPATGQFFITLPAGRLYSYVVKGPDIFPVSDNIDLRQLPEDIYLQRDITAPRIGEMLESDITLPLNNLFFENDEFRIRPASFPELNRLARLVQEYNLRLEISGHTDNVGGEDYNRTLSRNRAQAVQDYLIGKGCDPDQLNARGYGMEHPVDTNATESGRARNRRVEIRLTQMEN